MRLSRGVVPVEPAAGQESVWDYPRPPRVEATTDHVVIVLAGQIVCESRDAFRVLETSHPPSYYLPAAHWAVGSLHSAAGGNVCEFKGPARYLDVVSGSTRVPGAAWTYDEPWSGFEQIADYIAVYPGRMDEVRVNDELVRAQDGGFYGGWITDRVVGPFKGSPGSWGW